MDRQNFDLCWLRTPTASETYYYSVNDYGTSAKERPVSQNQEYSTRAMKVAFVAPPISGHLNPMTTLARELRSRDHEVVIISLPDGEASVRGAGLRFLPCAAKEFSAGSLKERFASEVSSREMKLCGLYYRVLLEGRRRC
jgi:hypothetical protein